ncbi:hypothetical protein Tco_1269189 [Tanacetum coccineum]
MTYMSMRDLMSTVTFATTRSGAYSLILSIRWGVVCEESFDVILEFLETGYSTFVFQTLFNWTEIRWRGCRLADYFDVIAGTSTTLVAISEVTKVIKQVDVPIFFQIKPTEYGRFLVLSLGTGSPEFHEKYDATKSSSWGVLGLLAAGGSTPLVDVLTQACDDMVDYHISVGKPAYF